MSGYEFLNFVALVPYTLGALVFAALAVSYWRERRRTRATILPGFTVACGAAFLLSLARALDDVPDAVTLAQDVVTGAIPPLLLHLIWSEEGRERRWRWGVAVFYVLGMGV